MVTLFTFGCGSRGELGLPRADDRCRPEATAVVFPETAPCSSTGEADVTAVALGTDHSLSVVGGHVFRWGLLCTRSPPRWTGGSTCGGEVVPAPAPVAAWTGGQSEGSEEQRFDGQVRSVTCGGSNSFMLTKDGEVFMLGDLRPPGGDAGRPRWLWGCPLKGAGERVAHIAAGWRHCLLLTEAGSLFALGDDEHGQCAGVNTGDVAVSLPTTQNAVGVAAGACHSVAWDSSGTAFTWGHGGCGRLGLGGQQHRRSPTQVDALREPVFSASCGANFTLFATSHGRALWACGGNQYGQLGLGAVSSSPTEVPRQLDLPRGSEDIISLACGMHHALCLTRLSAAPGQPIERCVAWAWGCAVSGQCGRAAGERRGSAPPQCRAAPEPLVDFLAPSPHWPLAVAAGRSHSAVLASMRPPQAAFAQTPVPLTSFWATPTLQQNTASTALHTGCALSPGVNGAISSAPAFLSPVPASPAPLFDSSRFAPLEAAVLSQHIGEQELAPNKKVVHEDIIDQFCASLVPSTAAPSGHSSTRTADFHLSSPTPQVLIHSPSQISSEPVMERASEFLPDAGRRNVEHPGGVSSRAASPSRSPTHGMAAQGWNPIAHGSPGISHRGHGLVAKGPTTGMRTVPPREQRMSRSMSEVALLVELGEAALRGDDEDESVQNVWDEKEPVQSTEHFYDDSGMTRSASATQLRSWNGKAYAHGARNGKAAKTAVPPSRRVSMDLEERRPRTVVTGVRGRAAVLGAANSAQHGNIDRRKQRWPAAPQSWGRSEEAQRSLRRSASAGELRSRSDGRGDRYAGHGHGAGHNAATRSSRRSSKYEVSHMQMLGAEGSMPGSPHDLFADFPAAESFSLEATAEARKNTWQAQQRTASPAADLSASRIPAAHPSSPSAGLSAWQWPPAQVASPSAALPVSQFQSTQRTPQFAGAEPAGFSPLHNPFIAPRRDEWSGVRDSLNDLTSMIASMKAPGSGVIGSGLSSGFTGSFGGGFSNTLSMDFGARVTNGAAEQDTIRRTEHDDICRHTEDDDISRRTEHDEIKLSAKSSPKLVGDGDASDAGITFSPSESEAAGSSRRSSTGSRRGAGGRQKQNGRRLRGGRAPKRNAANKDSLRSGAARKSPQGSIDTASASGSPDLGFTVTQPAALSPCIQSPRVGSEVREAVEKCHECGTVFMPESNFCMKCGSKRPPKQMVKHRTEGASEELAAKLNKMNEKIEQVDAHVASQRIDEQHVQAVLPAAATEPRSNSEARFVQAAPPVNEEGINHRQHQTHTSSSRPQPTGSDSEPAQEPELFVMGAPLGHHSSKSPVGSESPIRPKRSSATTGAAHQHPRSNSGSNAGASSASVRTSSKVPASASAVQEAKVSTSAKGAAKLKGSSRTPSSASASSKDMRSIKGNRKPAPATAPRAVEPVKQKVLPARSEQMRSRLSSDNSSPSGASRPTSPTGPVAQISAPTPVQESALVATQVLTVKSRAPRTPSVQSASSVGVSSHGSDVGMRSGAVESRSGIRPATALHVQPARQISRESSASSRSPGPRKPTQPTQASAPQPLGLSSANSDSSDDKEVVQPMVLSARGSSSGDDSPKTSVSPTAARRGATAVPPDSPIQTAPRFVKPAAAQAEESDDSHMQTAPRFVKPAAARAEESDDSPIQTAPRFVKPAAAPAEDSDDSPVQTAPRLVKPAAAPAEDVVPFSDGESSGKSSGGSSSLSPQEKLRVSSVAAAAVAATSSAMNLSDASSSSHGAPTAGARAPRDARTSRDSSPSGSSTGSSSSEGGKMPTQQVVKPVAVGRPDSAGPSQQVVKPVAVGSPGSGSSSDADSSPVAAKRTFVAPAAHKQMAGSSSDADSSPVAAKRTFVTPAAPKQMAGPPIGAPPAGLRAPPAPVTTMLESFSSGEDLDVEEISG